MVSLIGPKKTKHSKCLIYTVSLCRKFDPYQKQDTDQWQLSFVDIYHIPNDIIHPSHVHTACATFGLFEFRDTENMTVNDETEGRCIGVIRLPSTFRLPPPGWWAGLSKRNSQAVCDSKQCETQSRAF